MGTITIAEDASPEAMIDNVEDYNIGYFSFEEARKVICYSSFSSIEEIEYDGKRVVLKNIDKARMETLFLGII